MSRSRSRRRRGGFTLMEVLLVLAILVILGALAFFSFGDTLFQSKKQLAQTQVNGLKTPINQYVLGEGTYPTQLTQLWDGSSKTGRSYLETPLGNDPWGQPYNYEPPSDPSNPQSKYRISSNGPDMQAGTADDISNLTANQQ